MKCQVIAKHLTELYIQHVSDISSDMCRTSDISYSDECRTKSTSSMLANRIPLFFAILRFGFAVLCAVLMTVSLIYLERQRISKITTYKENWDPSQHEVGGYTALILAYNPQIHHFRSNKAQQNFQNRTLKANVE